MKKEEKKEVVSKSSSVNDRKRADYIAENKKKKKEKKKRENIFKVIKRYFVGVGKEIKRIRWTSGSELVKYSIASVILILSTRRSSDGLPRSSRTRPPQRSGRICR